jgi:hypothetical protein
MTFRVDWSEEAERRLILLWQDPTLSTTGLGIALGVSYRAAKNKARRLGLGARPLSAYQGRPWTADEDATLRAVYAEGGNALAAAAALCGRTVHGVLSRARKLGLQVDPRLKTLTTPGIRSSSAETDPNAGLPVDRPPVHIAPWTAPPMLPVPPAKTCQYPLWGNTERASGRLCDGPLFRGSYCVDHFGACYLSRNELEKVF